MKPPEDVVYLTFFEGKASGTGRISRLKKDDGEIKQIYIRPQYRGRESAKEMLLKLLETGEELGYSTFLLDV